MAGHRSRIMLAAAAAATIIGGVMTVGAQQRVEHIRASEVDKAFAKGATLVELGDVRIITSTRTETGESEQHADEADIFYVVEGTATFVTGGRLVGGRTTAPGEIRGTAIEGGESRTLSTGDVITIPAGVPHWFKSVDGRFRYYIVKVKS
jgi:mannose-6-phosphate isomerase-like protein (cupin superfamily)